jgi:putative membrane protein
MRTPVSTNWIAVIGLSSVLFLPMNAAAQRGDAAGAEKSGTEKSAMNKSQSSDTMFLTHAAQDGEAEVELGKLAQQNAANAQVKAFGERMQADHSKANAELRTIAEKKGVKVPAGPGPHASMKAKLEKLQGAQFDQAYMRAMVDDHTKAVKEFETASKSTDSDVSGFAAKTLPTLREHLRLAQDTQRAVAGGTSGTSGTSTAKPNAPTK